LYNSDATPNAVIVRAPTHNVIHIACHGWFDDDNPEHSGLALAGGWLTVQRIITELRLENTHLVTLASCLGAKADAKHSGEIMSITHALMTAGAQSVVSALWSVEVNATMALFQTFYQHIIAGEPPAVALRAAMEAIRATPEWEHPYYWAAWQVHGLAL
jgi:CHAT domain-containing protein